MIPRYFPFLTIALAMTTVSLTLTPFACAQTNEAHSVGPEGGVAGRVLASTPYLETLEVIVRQVEGNRETKSWTVPVRDGTFEIGDVPAGAVVNVQAYSHYYRRSHKVERIPAGTTDLVLELPELRTISGVVTDASTGEPVTVFTVTPGVVDEQYPHQYKNETHHIKAPRGRFNVPVPVTGECIVAIQASGYLIASSEPFAIEPGADPEPLTFALTPGHSLRGRVVDNETGEGIEGVYLSAPAYTPATGLAESAHAVSDASGAFVLEGLAAGTNAIYLRDRLRSNREQYLPTRVENVNIPEVTDLGMVAMSEGGGVEGVVRFEDGTPVTQGRFHVQVPHQHMPTRTYTSTSATGYYALNKLPEGSHPARLSIKLPDQMQSGVQVWSGTASIENGRMNSLDITVPTGRTFTGTVTRDGEPLQRGSISLVQAEGWGHGQVRQWGNNITDGEYQFRVVDSGSFAVIVTTNETSFGNMGQVVIHEPRGEEMLDIDVKVLRVAGKVVDATGNPLAGVQGHIYPAGLSGNEHWVWQHTNNWTADDLGTFTAFVPAPGHYVLSPQLGQREGFRPEKVRVPLGGLEGALLKQEDRQVRGGPNHYIAGRVTDVSGHAVQNVVVSASRTGSRHQERARPDAQGHFRFDGLYPGTYHISAEPNWPRHDPAPLAAVEVEAPRDDLHLVLPPGVIVQGRVTDAETGKPLNDINLSQDVLGTKDIDFHSGGILQTTDDSFSLYYPPSEKLSLRLSKDGFVGEVPIDATNTVPGTVIGPLDIRFERAAVIAGRIDYATPYVDRFSVQLLSSHEDRTAIESTSPRNGTFRFDRVPHEGTFTIRVYSPYLNETLVEGVRPGAEELVIEMPETRTLSGTVRDATGEPISEYRITMNFRSADGTISTSGLGHEIKDPEGRFRIPVPLAKEMSLIIDAPGYAKAWSNPFPVLQGEEPEPLEFSLRKGYTITGRVVNEVTQMPVEEVYVNAFATDGEGHGGYAGGRTGINGQFHLDGIPAHPIRLTFTLPDYRNRGYLSYEQELTVSGNTDVGVMEMPVGGTVEGVARWADGSPITLGSVQVAASHHRPSFHGTSFPLSATGYYAIRGLPEGPYPLTLQVSLPEQENYEREIRHATVEVEVRTTTRHDFVLPPGRLFSGTVTEDGEIWDAGHVYLFRVDGPYPSMPHLWGDSIKNGRFRFRVLDTGTLTVMVRREEAMHRLYGSLGQVTIDEATGEQTLDLEFDLIEIAGRVLDATGNPAHRVVGFLYPPGASEKEEHLHRYTNNWYTNDLGEFTAWVPEPGDYILRPDYGPETFEAREIHVPAEGLRDVTIQLRETP